MVKNPLMANCDSLFRDYDSTIKLSDAKRTSLTTSRKRLREKIETFFDEEIEVYVPIFKPQGSFAMDTIITPLSGEYDIDDGIYISGNESEVDRETPATFHTWVYDAVDGHTDEIIDKNTCIRVVYSDGHHIDMPIYYHREGFKPQLAHKGKGWIDSDPVEFTEWFEDKQDTNGQLLRIVRYLKGWGDYKAGDMPTGLIMTILGANKYQSDLRDDIAFHNTVKAIHDSLQISFTCFRPTTPANENLFADYSTTRKNYFLAALDSIIKSGSQAIEETNQKEACKKWQKHFGDRFSCSAAKDESESRSKYSQPAILTQNAKSA